FSTLLALCTPLPSSPGDPDDSEAWDADQALIRSLMQAIRDADACLGRGDAAAARKLMDRWEVLQALDVQSLARLAQAWLIDEEAPEEEQFDKAFALASFHAMHAERKMLERRDLPLPRGRWDDAKLDDVFARATQWLDAHLGNAWPMPPGGL